MRKVLIAFAIIILLPSVALARGGHGGGGGGGPGGGGGARAGGGWSGGHAASFSGGARSMSGGWSGARMGGGWSGARMGGPARVSGAAVMGGPARMSGMGNWRAQAAMGTWKGGNWNQAGNWKGNWHNGHRHFRRNVVFVGGGPWWGWGGYGFYDNSYYDDGCWQWVETRRGLRRVWACGDYY
jgi:translation initiation factor IF-2